LTKPGKLKVSAADDLEFQSILRSSNENVERLRLKRLQAFQNDEPEHQLETEINQLRFSEHLFELKAGLAQLSAGATLKISSLSKILISELAAACRVMHLPIETRQYRKFHFLYVTRKAIASVHSIPQQSTTIENAVNKRTA